MKQEAFLPWKGMNYEVDLYMIVSILSHKILFKG